MHHLSNNPFCIFYLYYLSLNQCSATITSVASSLEWFDCNFSIIDFIELLILFVLSVDGDPTVEFFKSIYKFFDEYENQNQYVPLYDFLKPFSFRANTIMTLHRFRFLSVNCLEKIVAAFPLPSLRFGIQCFSSLKLVPTQS